VSFSDQAQFLIDNASIQSVHCEQELHHGEPPQHSFSPCVVVSHESDEIDASFLRQKLSIFLKDSEFLPQFLTRVVFARVVGPENTTRHPEKLEITAGARNFLSDNGCVETFSVSVGETSDSLPEGPYFMKDAALHRTWRLFPDEYEAFQLPVIQSSSSKFTGITITHAGKLMVPVPSRLHSPRSPSKPLNGLRFTVKDIIDLEGVKTTAQFRAYEKTYDEAKCTAPSVEHLLELGAVVIGKTKCTQFASSDQPTGGWVDYHCPWNPRGDGYLSPRGSSTGASVAVAGYEWVDFGLGTDS